MMGLNDVIGHVGEVSIEQLLKYIKWNNVRMFKWFLDQHTMPNNIDRNGPKIVSRCTLNNVDKFGRTTMNFVLLLIIEVMPEKWEQMLLLLIQKNVNINGIDEEGNTALHLISTLGKRQPRAYMMTKFLLENGADPNIKNKQDQTPLLKMLYSMFYNRKRRKNPLSPYLFDIIKLFIDYNTNLNAPNYRGVTVLRIAVCLTSFADIIVLLIENGADVNASYCLGSTPLHRAIENGFYEYVSILLKKGADVHIVDQKGCTSLHVAVKYTNFKIIELLFKYGACSDIDKLNFDHQTPLNLACSLGSIQIIKLLVRNALREVTIGHSVLTDLFCPQNFRNELNWIFKSQINIEKSLDYFLNYNNYSSVTSDSKELILCRALTHVRYYNNMVYRNIKSTMFKKRKIINPMLYFDYFMEKNVGKRLTKRKSQISRRYRTYKMFQKSCRNVLKLLVNSEPKNLESQTKDNTEDPIQQSIGIDRELQNYTTELLLSNGYDIYRFAFNKPSLYYYAVTFNSHQGVLYLYHNGINFICNRAMARISTHKNTFAMVNVRNLMLLIIRELQIRNRLMVENERYLKKALKRNKLCIKEINKMIITKIGCSSITYFEFALANKQRLSTILSNNDIYQIFDNEQYRNCFPNFKYHLEDQFLIGRERFKLCARCFHIFLTQTVFQSEHIIRFILSHLSNDDLVTMIEAFSSYH